VFRSAGVRPDLPGIANFLSCGGKLTSQIELAFAILGRDRIIGVTGTLGKGTCCSLLHAMLTEAGIPASLGGNIGVPALDLIATLGPREKLILELSSFQLATLATSPTMAAVLKTTSEHLDWHLSRDEYWHHKANLVRAQTQQDVLVFSAEDSGSVWIAEKSRARKLPYGHKAEGHKTEIQIEGDAVHWKAMGFSLPLSSTRLKGGFNLENLAAAGTLALELGAEPKHVLAASAAFSGLEHRLEFIREIQGLAYYNDSYATRPEATIGAIAAFPSMPLGLILGGSDKLADFSELAHAIAASPQIRAIALIGQTAERLESELRTVGLASSGEPALLKVASLEEAVQFLQTKLKKGCILLSPACASFGMFENYKARGKFFKDLVTGL
jgi:UDP-N-acetylmuramoylalanine--D-glutamate ligase